MGDRAHSWTDWKIGEIEKELDRIYSRAEKELEEKAEKYFNRFEELDAKKRALLDAGKMTEEEYRKWRTGKIMTGKHWTDMKKDASEQLLKVNQTATAYVNDQLPTVYVRNYNQVANGINGQIKGYSFELVDSSTVRRLATDNKTLLPYKYIDGVKDVRWNTQKVNSEILQGILQGDSIPNLAKRLRAVTEMNRNSAIRNARTTCTSAENKGRMDMLHDAEDNGVKTQKGWLATNDNRTRDSHAELNGVFVDIDDEFDNGLEYPGDPNGDPSEVYNCRCTLVYKVVGFGNKEPTLHYNSETISTQIETPAMNEYDYWSAEQTQFRYNEIETRTGFYENKTQEVLNAFCGDSGEYYGIEHTPEGWFYRADARIRDLDGEKWTNAAKAIDDYIVAAPKYDGSIFRGLSLDAETVKEIQKGGSFTEKGSLSSWTSSIDIAQMFAEGRTEELGLTPVIIETKAHPFASPVSHLSIFGSEENEVIVSNMHGNEYTIEDIKEKDGILHVILTFGGK